MLPAPLAYAELGYAVLPIVAGKKTPLTANGCKDATTDGERIERWIDQFAGCNWAIATDGLLVVDIDVDGSGKANPWLAEDPDKAMDLAAAPTSLTPRGGRHFIFRQPGRGMIGNSAGRLAPHVDTRGTGGYIVVPPSQLADGRSYKWVAGGLDVAPSELPEPPDWLLELLCDGERPACPRNRQAQPANKIPTGQRNDALASLAGTMRRVGMSYSEIEAALQRCNADRCNPPLSPSEIDAIARSVASYEPDGVAVAIAEQHAAQDAADWAAENAGPADPGEFPAELLTVPGFIGDVIAHNLATAFRPQPTLALAGALCLLATLTGRKVRDTYDSRTNLFCVGTCDTSKGKDHARKINKEILTRAGAETLFGPESIESSAGLISAVELSPSCLFQLDEFGRHLATVGDARQAHLFNIPSVMMKLFTLSNQTFVGGAYADVKKIKRINQPHAVFYGTTTPEVFYASLSNNAIYDGFMSRLLIFEGGDSPKQRKPQIDVPQPIIDQAKEWAAFQPGGNAAPLFPQPITVQILPEAERLTMDLDELAESEAEKIGKPLGGLWPRAVEKANKLALLYACSADAKAPVVTGDAAKWACAVVDYLTRRLVYLAARYLAENRQESHVKRLARILEDAGPSGLDKTHLTRATQWLTRRERDEILMTLAESGQVASRQIETTRRPRTVYVHAKHAARA